MTSGVWGLASTPVVKVHEYVCRPLLCGHRDQFWRRGENFFFLEDGNCKDVLPAPGEAVNESNAEAGVGLAELSL